MQWKVPGKSTVKVSTIEPLQFKLKESDKGHKGHTTAHSISSPLNKETNGNYMTSERDEKDHIVSHKRN